MSLSLLQSLTAIAPRISAPFQATGGTAPYAYAVLPGGAGGSIDSSSGIYTAPIVVNPDPKKVYDTIQVTDSLAATATAQILVGNPLQLLCDVLATELGLAPGRVYLWDQKNMQPTDAGMFIVVQELNPKCFGNIIKNDPITGDSLQSVNMHSMLSIDIKSRGPEARDRKEEVVMALKSIYSEQQQNANNFRIFPVIGHIVNLSEIDGAAIPYRYNLSANIQYSVSKTKAVPLYTQFSDAEVTTGT